MWAQPVTGTGKQFLLRYQQSIRSPPQSPQTLLRYTTNQILQKSANQVHERKPVPVAVDLRCTLRCVELSLRNDLSERVNFKQQRQIAFNGINYCWYKIFSYETTSLQVKSVCNSSRRMCSVTQKILAESVNICQQYVSL